MRLGLAATFALVLAVGLARMASADEPPIPLPPPAVPAPEPAPQPPILGDAGPPPALPAGVTPIEDARSVTFVLSGGNRIVARRIGEDPEYVWVETDGHQARIRKTDIASMDFQGGPARPAAPPPPVTNAPPANFQYYNPPPPAPKGRGMVIWGGIMLGVGYTLAIAASTNESTGTDGSSILLAIPLVGPFFFAGTDAAEGEPMIWILDGLMQIGGLGLLYFGIRKLSEQPDRPDPRTPRVGLSISPHGAFAQATWAL